MGYCMVTEQTLIRFGFTNDKNNLKLKKAFKNNLKLKEIHIDVYPENPLVASSDSFMLLSRTIEKNVTISNDENRLILKKNDEYKTYFMNILFSKVSECYCKVFDNYSEFILNIQNTYFKLTVLN